MLKKPQTVTIFGGSKPNLHNNNSIGSRIVKDSIQKSISSSVERTTYYKNKKSYDKETREKFM